MYLRKFKLYFNLLEPSWLTFSRTTTTSEKERSYKYSTHSSVHIQDYLCFVLAYSCIDLRLQRGLLMCHLWLSEHD